MNLPNRLTLARIFLIPLILLFLLPLPDRPVWQDWNLFLAQSGRLVAFFLFALAALTDLVDGRVARKMGQVTTFGKFLDPIADKMLVCSVLIALVQLGRVHAILTIVIIIREFVITGVRLIAAEHDIVIAAGNLGKAKTVAQIVAILLILAENTLIKLLGGLVSSSLVFWSGNVVFYIAVILTFLSGWQYLAANKSLLKG